MVISPASCVVTGKDLGMSSSAKREEKQWLSLTGCLLRGRHFSESFRHVNTELSTGPTPQGRKFKATSESSYTSLCVDRELVC